MNLTLYSDYSLRVLIYLAAHPERYSSTQEISEAYGISQNHLIKVVNKLGHEGFIEIKRGRHGGIRLGKKPAEIRIGDVVRKTEPNFHIATCFDTADLRCPIIPVCGLKGVLNKALQAFFFVLDNETLASVIEKTPGGIPAISALLKQPKKQPAPLPHL